MPGQNSAALVFDLQAKLNGSRSAGIGDGAEAAGERPRTAGTTGRSERCGKVGSETARCRVNVAVKEVEERGLEVKETLFSKETSFLTDTKVLVSATERARARKGAALISEREGTGNRERGGVPKRRVRCVEIRALVRLGYPGDDVDAGESREVASGKQEIACCATAWTVNLGGKSGMIGQDT